MSDSHDLRSSLTQFNTSYGKDLLIGLEIGVAYGYHAKSILDSMNIEKLYLVDPFKQYCGYTDYIPQDIYKQCCNNLNSYKDKIYILKFTSREAAKKLENIKFDFIYIDGNHRYEFVKGDIELWYNKVKVNGMLCGHDFNNMGVFKAVTEYSNKHNIICHTLKDDWWFIKNE